MDVVRYDVRITTNTVLLFVTGMIIASMALLADLIVRSRGDTGRPDTCRGDTGRHDPTPRH